MKTVETFKKHFSDTNSIHIQMFNPLTEVGGAKEVYETFKCQTKTGNIKYKLSHFVSIVL